MRTEELELTDEELDQATQPGIVDPEIQDQDITDELDPEVEGTDLNENQEPAVEVLAAPDPMVLIADLQRQLEELRKAPKNQVPGTPGNRSYVRNGPLNTEGKIPQQQGDLAKILVDNMPVGEKFTEAQVFAFLEKDKPKYQSLLGSKQDVTYLFKYYRGLKPQGKHAGFVARKFLVQS